MSIKEDLLSVSQDGTEDYVDLLSTIEQVNSDKRELDQLMTVSDSLETLITNLEGVTELTPEYAKLVQASCENLLIGTHHDHTFLLPSLESNIGGTVSTESLRDRLSEIWKRIVSAILSVLSGLKKIWTKISTFKGRLELSATEVKRAGTLNRNRRIKNPMVEVGFNARNLVVGKQMMPDADSMIRACSALKDQYKTVTNMYAKGMLSVGATYENLLRKPTNDVRELLEEICAAGTNLPFATIGTSLHAMAYRDPRFGNKPILAAPPLLGGFSLYILSPEIPSRGLVGNELLTMASRQRTAGIRFSQTDLASSKLNSGTIKTATGQQVETLADKVLGLLKLIDDQEPARQVRRLESQIKSLLSTAESFKAHPLVGEGNLVYSESILRHVRTYVTWSTGPVDSMTTNLLTVSRAILIYAKHSLQN